MAVLGVKGVLITERNFDSAIRVLERASRLNMDAETTGLEWSRPEVVACGYSVMVPYKDKTKWKPMYFPFRHGTGRNLKEKHRLAFVRAITGKTITNWNTKFDLHIVKKDGVPIPDYAEDMMLMHHLLNENERNYKLKDIASDWIDPSANAAQKELKLALARRKMGMGDMWRLDPREVSDYACDDVVLVEMLRRLYVPALREWKLGRIAREVNEYMVETTHMEENGLVVDEQHVRYLAREAEKEIEPALRVIKEMAGYDINLNSNPQLQAFLGMKSTRKELLQEKLETDPENPAINALMTYRGWTKVLSSYYGPYIEKIEHSRGGRVYPNIKLHGTVSGRPSCEDPNLQAIPRTPKVGSATYRMYRVKEVFVAPKGMSLVQADLSQAELRLFAHVAQDPIMLKAFEDFNVDIHKETADRMGVDRDYAKRINFGIVYGLGARGLSHSLKIALADAEYYMDLYHNLYTTIKPTYRRLESQAHANGYIRLWTGRVRHYDSMRFPEERKALSNTVQGGVAEMMRVMITRMSKRMRDPNDVMYGTKLLLQIHDANMFYVPNKKRDLVLPEIQKEMTNFKFSVMFKVDIATGERWAGIPDRKIEGLKEWKRAA